MAETNGSAIPHRQAAAAPIPITIVTGFLGSGKTTLIINLIPQLPPNYRLALLKNEFGDLAVDSQLASARAISGVRELLNGCICCNLVGQLSDALETLAAEAQPDRIVIETSGSAFPATLAMEVNRLARETGGMFALDGVLSVIDVENWKGYEDTSVTAKMQARYTDLVVFNKHEECGERRFDECLDRLGDLEVQTPWVKSDRGVVGKDVILGIDGALARELGHAVVEEGEHKHGGKEHHSEVEVLSVTLGNDAEGQQGVDLGKLEEFLLRAPKDEIYRIKAVLLASTPPTASSGEQADAAENGSGAPSRYILNWAFGRWTFTAVSSILNSQDPKHQPNGEPAPDERAALRMTIVLAPYESKKWKKRIDEEQLFTLEGAGASPPKLRVQRIS